MKIDFAKLDRAFNPKCVVVIGDSKKNNFQWLHGQSTFTGKLRDELINREIFTTLLETKILVEEWRKEYNQIRPHSSLGSRPLAPEVIQPTLMPATLT